jgi:acetyl-CoA/propionyl-CoA carboxylase, biotin carboxylase, biotin carboxyl carrier protein
MATALPFHRAVLRDAAFTDEPFTVHTRWIETEWVNEVPPFTAAVAAATAEEPRETVVVEVGGKRLEVTLPAGLGAGAPGAGANGPKVARKRGAGRKHAGGVSGDALASPMQGTIVKIAVAEGDTVAEGDLVVVLEAMKMEQPLNAHKDGVVTGLTATVGEVVPAGTVICEIR